MKVTPGELRVYQAVHHDADNDTTICISVGTGARRKCGGIATLSEGAANLAAILAKEEGQVPRQEPNDGNTYSVFGTSEASHQYFQRDQHLRDKKALPIKERPTIPARMGAVAIYGDSISSSKECKKNSEHLQGFDVGDTI